jgi:tetratricopeptide (TPR) repeat protein
MTTTQPTLSTLQSVQRNLLQKSINNPKYLLQHSIVTANRVALYIKNERFRSSLKEIDLAFQSLEQYTKSKTVVEPMAVHHRVRLHYLHGMSLQHLKGKGKGIKHSIITLEKGIELMKEAELKEEIYVDIDLRIKLESLCETLKSSSKSSPPSTSPLIKSSSATKEKPVELLQASATEPTTPPQVKKKVQVSTEQKVDMALPTPTPTSTPTMATPVTTKLKPTIASSIIATPAPTPAPTPTPTPTQNIASANELNQILRVGYMYVNTGKLKKAVEIFNEILQLDPSNIGALLGRGSAWALSASSSTKDQTIQIELYKNSINDFTTAIQYHPYNADSYKRRGQVYGALGGETNNKLAIKDLDQSIELNNKDYDALQQRGQLYHRLKNYTKALIDIKQALLLSEKEYETENSASTTTGTNDKKATIAHLWNSCGLTLNAMGCNKEAIQCYQRALLLTGNSMSEAYTNLGQSYRDYGDKIKSIESFHKSLELNNTSSITHHMLGLLHHGCGEYTLGLESFSNGLLYDSKHEGCRLMNGLLLQSIGQFNEAMLNYKMLQMNSSMFLRFFFVVFFADTKY